MVRPPVIEVQRKLQAAADQQLTKVLALVDAMPTRGAADALIAPLRPRLAAIEPARPMSITRLLFRPLDPVIAAGPRWRPGIPAVPRTALPSIGQAAVAQLGAAADRVGAMIVGRDGKDVALAEAAGALLWPAAAAIMPDLPIPADWGSSGLPDACYPEIRANIAAILHQAVPLFDVANDYAGLDLVSAIRAILMATQARHPAGVGIVMAVLLTKGGAAAAVLEAAVKLPGQQVDRAVEQTLDRMQQIMSDVMPLLSVANAAAHAMQAANLLEAIEGPHARPLLRSQAQRTRQVADEACQIRLMSALDEDFLPKLSAAEGEIDAAALEALEGSARGLRRLSLAGRRLGAGPAYDKLLGKTAKGACTSDTTLTRMERLRLAELLVGSEMALGLMHSFDEIPKGRG